MCKLEYAQYSCGHLGEHLYTKSCDTMDNMILEGKKFHELLKIHCDKTEWIVGRELSYVCRDCKADQNEEREAKKKKEKEEAEQREEEEYEEMVKELAGKKKKKKKKR